MLIPLGFLAGSGGEEASSFELIETQVLSSSAASVSFTSLGTYSSTYKHLQLRFAARGSVAAVISGVRLRLGAGSLDTGSNYSRHQLYGYNGSVTSYGEGTQTSMFSGACPGSSAGSNIFGAATIDLLDVFSSTKNKTVRTLSGVSAGTGTNAFVTLESGAWLSTSSVQQINIFAASGDFVSGSRFSLYGIKG
jgi:hypothetical protein